MKTLGIDIGSSSVKVALLDAMSGYCMQLVQVPDEEQRISSPVKGWAEQDPEMWWTNLIDAIRLIGMEHNLREVEAIGITYQMHGLVAVDTSGNPVRPSIIWCDSRAVQIGNEALIGIGRDYCLKHHLNSPGNFTASKLAWIGQHEPEVYEKIDKIMLPGDYIALKLTGEATTTAQGLSEGVLWDFKNNAISEVITNFYDIDRGIISDLVPCFGVQCSLSAAAASLLGMKAGTPISYRSGDQPNNAFSLNVLNPGEIAATAGTSGVVYGVSSRVAYDPQSRVNSFMHVNHRVEDPRIGVLLCINGTGILNSWMRKNVAKGLTYAEMNSLAATVAPGSEGLSVLPFGNGAERVFHNNELGAHIFDIDFNRHTTAHMLRAAQEGIAFSLRYGIDVMSKLGVGSKVIRAGIANLFQSDVFTQTLANIANAQIELYDTNGAVGAARGAAVGIGFYKGCSEAFSTLKVDRVVEPQPNPQLDEAYMKWSECLIQLTK